MERTLPLFQATVCLLLGIVLAAAIAHEQYIAACVCVVNSMARATVSLVASLLFSSILMILPASAGKVNKVLVGLQVASFVMALFFLAQHVFFVLELA